ncbi:hypothetical protein CRUP_027677 [Coryphaenoides rupestris]|nr:hypothetical protein CRUP_027677 [Coryphaenoides rupestris]
MTANKPPPPPPPPAPGLGGDLLLPSPQRWGGDLLLPPPWRWGGDLLLLLPPPWRWGGDLLLLILPPPRRWGGDLLLLLPPAPEATGFSRLFPGLKPHLLMLPFWFRIPLFRDYIMTGGLVSSCKASLSYLLSRPEGGHVAVLAVGGPPEALDARPGALTLQLLKKKGFIKMALKHGAHLVPVFSFGENELFDQMPNPSGSPLRSLQHPTVQVAELRQQGSNNNDDDQGRRARPGRPRVARVGDEKPGERIKTGSERGGPPMAGTAGGLTGARAPSQETRQELTGAGPPRPAAVGAGPRAARAGRAGRRAPHQNRR